MLIFKLKKWEKIEWFKLPNGYTVRPVLIYSDVLASGIEEDGSFYHILDFDNHGLIKEGKALEFQTRRRI